MRSSAPALHAALLAGCTSAPPDEALLWSDSLERSLARERGAVDYRREFGEEPGDIVAVGVMTDSGDDDSTRRAFYGDITLGSDE